MKNSFLHLQKTWFVCYLKISVVVCMGMYGCTSEKKYNNPVVVIETKFGDIKVELYPQQAPATVAAFLQNIDSGYFKDCSFYRILRNDNQVTGSLHSFLIQGGVWQAKPDRKSKFKLIPHEPTNKTGILHKRGIISMARNEPGTATSEFFICVEDEPGFDFGGANNNDGQGYAAFGKVVEGMETVDRIHLQPEDDQRFTPPVDILNIKRWKAEPDIHQ